MPDPIFITADDRRIRDLALLDSLLLNDRLPMDKAGLTEAKYYTPQMLLNLMAGNIVNPSITAGTTNPDNAVGNNGDTYYKYLVGESFGVWTKVAGAWSELFNLVLSKLITKAGANVHVDGYIDLNAEVNIPPFPTVAVYINGDQMGSVAQWQATTKRLYGFSGSEALGDVIKIRFT